MKRTRLTLMALTLATLCLTGCLTSKVLADEQITVSATGSDISEQLDLRVVATLFAESKDLEEFETKLNNPDSAFTNLDLNGDGEIDYLRVVETSVDNKHLIVIQAVLAKDIYQDVASIYVEKDETEKVTVQIVGDEYIYGANYVIEPVYYVRPVIYDWFWGPTWTAWYSPYYWGYYPGWWYAHSCWAYDHYWHHCHYWHHHHNYCSYRYTASPRSAARQLGGSVSRREFAQSHPDRSFEARNQGVKNARQLSSQRRADGARSERIGASQRQAAGVGAEAGASARQNATTATRQANSSRTFGSSHVSTGKTGSTRRDAQMSREGASARQQTAISSSRARTSTARDASSRSKTVGQTRSLSSSDSQQRSSRATSQTRSSMQTSTQRSQSRVSTSQSNTRSSTHSFSSGSSSRSSYSSGSSTRSSTGGFSGGGARSAGGGFSSGGASSRGAAGSSRR